jgi:thioredoxin
MATVTLTETNFDDTVTSDGIVLVDYWADWCPPCKMFSPVYEKASDAHRDIVFGKVDTEAQRGIPVVPTIRSIPTLQAFRDGILVFSQAGALPSASLEKVISAVRDLDMDDVRKQIAAHATS